MDVWLGTINTGVLLTSSLTMALAVHAAEVSNRRQLMWLLVATMVLGAIFLGVKVVEYTHKYEHHLIPFAGLEFAYTGPEKAGTAAFFNLYFLMTGLHAFHMVIGIGVMLVLLCLAWRGGLLGSRAIIVHNTGLYWHFVDLVWVYLFPFFYLVGVRAAAAH
jgi:cytochrome c oxidase subunit 3